MDTVAARKALGKKLAPLSADTLQTRPHRGWIRAIRDALGMSAAQLAKKMGVSQPRVTALEKAEADDSVTLASLRRAAEALDCTLVYALVPKTSLDDMVMTRARAKAAKILQRVDHTMSLERQNLEDAETREQIEILAQDLIARNVRILWDEDKT